MGIQEKDKKEKEMELKKDTTESVKFAYENEGMPNPNDSLFGNTALGGGVSDFTLNEETNGGLNHKKPGVPKWLLIICGVAVLAVIAIFALKLIGGNKLDGAYVAEKIELKGVEYTIEELEAVMGTSLYIRLEIDGDEGYLVMSFAGMMEDGQVDIKVDGEDIHVKGDGSELTFNYDKKTDTISYEKDGSTIIFERIQ